MRDEEIQVWVKSAIGELQAGLAAGRSEELERYLAAMARFPSYSWHNVLLIAAQRPDATRVAGFQAWRRLGRWVRQGERGIAIRAPVRLRAAANDQDDVRYFRIVHVFDVSQTEGEPLPALATASGDPGAAVERLLGFAADRAIQVRREDLGGPAGLSAGGLIRVQRGLPPAEMCSVLVHELAHEILHQERTELGLSQRVQETEAEAVAFVVCQAIGLASLAASRDYIALYQGDADLLTACLGRIQRAAAEILGGLGDGPANVATVALAA